MSLRKAAMACALAACASAPALAASDAVRGEQLYARCLACHALAYDRVGPRHCGLLGRRAGSVAGFDYSPAMKRSRIVWDRASLDRFLAHPVKTVPGTSMTYDGVPGPEDRSDLIAYLTSVNQSAECRKQRAPDHHVK
jgi:cytochrome c